HWCGSSTSILFFFQAEDGIRDFHVTGVQTCALPICSRATKSLMMAGSVIVVDTGALLSFKANIPRGVLRVNRRCGSGLPPRRPGGEDRTRGARGRNNSSI